MQGRYSVFLPDALAREGALPDALCHCQSLTTPWGKCRSGGAQERGGFPKELGDNPQRKKGSKILS